MEKTELFFVCISYLLNFWCLLLAWEILTRVRRRATPWLFKQLNIETCGSNLKVKISLKLVQKLMYPTAVDVAIPSCSTTSKKRCFSGDRISGLIVIETPCVYCSGQWFSASTVLCKSSENCLTSCILTLETQGGIQPQDQDIFMVVYIFRKCVLINFCCLLMWT